MLNPIYKDTQIVNRHAHISNISKIDLTNAIQIDVPPLVTEQVWQIAQERLRNNKHVKPNKQGEFLLQGMITCGVCGYTYRAQRVNSTRYYLCRGRMKYHHP